MRLSLAAGLAGTLLLAVMAVQPVAAQELPGKSKRPGDCLVFGTVFTEQGFLLPGARIRVRREGEKKVRGEAASDRRGEFAIRVPLGFPYEVRVSARGFEEQAAKVDAKFSSRADLVFRMKPAPGGKSK